MPFLYHLCLLNHFPKKLHLHFHLSYLRAITFESSHAANAELNPDKYYAHILL